MVDGGLELVEREVHGVVGVIEATVTDEGFAGPPDGFAEGAGDALFHVEVVVLHGADVVVDALESGVEAGEAFGIVGEVASDATCGAAAFRASAGLEGVEFVEVLLGVAGDQGERRGGVEVPGGGIKGG